MLLPRNAGVLIVLLLATFFVPVKALPVFGFSCGSQCSEVCNSQAGEARNRCTAACIALAATACKDAVPPLPVRKTPAANTEPAFSGFDFTTSNMAGIERTVIDGERERIPLIGSERPAIPVAVRHCPLDFGRREDGTIYEVLNKACLAQQRKDLKSACHSVLTWKCPAVRHTRDDGTTYERPDDSCFQQRRESLEKFWFCRPIFGASEPAGAK